MFKHVLGKEKKKLEIIEKKMEFSENKASDLN